MAREYAVLRTDGFLPLSTEARLRLGVVPGAWVEIIAEDDKLVLSSAPKLDPLRILRSLAVQDNLEEELQTMRREEEEHSLRKYGC